MMTTPMATLMAMLMTTAASSVHTDDEAAPTTRRAVLLPIFVFRTRFSRFAQSPLGGGAPVGGARVHKCLRAVRAVA
jgi:hypothetical protein